MLQSLINRELKNAIEGELNDYNVKYLISSRGEKCFVDMETADGSKDRVYFNGAPRSGSGHNTVKILGDIRRALKQIGASKAISRRERGKSNTNLGDKLCEAAQVFSAPVFNGLAPTYEHAHNIEPPEPPEPPRSVPAKPAPVATTKEPPPMAILEAVPAKLNAVNGNHAPAAADKKDPKYVKLLQGEVAKATRLIGINAAIDDDTRTVVYNDGWNDARIAKILAAEPGRDALTEKHVTNMRREFIGLLPAEHAAAKPKGPASLEDLLARVAVLEEKMAKYEAALGPV